MPNLTLITLGLMVKNTTVDGKTVNNMAKANTQTQKESNEKVSGRMANEQSGSMARQSDARS